MSCGSGLEESKREMLNLLHLQLSVDVGISTQSCTFPLLRGYDLFFEFSELGRDEWRYV